MLERLNEAMEHIERHLDRPVGTGELARIAMTSDYHFRRMFSTLAGMPLSEYLRRRRLTVAGAEVLAGERTLLDIAMRYGYCSGEAFARAFRGLHGVGPGEARRTGAALRSQPRMTFRLIVEGSSTMEYRIVAKKEFRVVGKKARVPLVYEGANPAIVEFVKGLGTEMVQRIHALSDQDPEGIVAVCDGLDPNRAEGTELDYYHAVVTNAPVPPDMDTLTVPPGTWAVFTNTGPYPQALQTLWADIFAQWFPSNPYRSRPGPEILRTRMAPDGTTATSELWIPVERTPV
ncbi:GyrI-like domain-containing protein [Streptomyces sp. NPDC004296]|uniref:GyrI-like domain-containing protein n=1 Tax=Streptomyces sp. NPDC004296 TaxID=3364697 RepID=UPI0036935D1C